MIVSIPLQNLIKKLIILMHFLSLGIDGDDGLSGPDGPSGDVGPVGDQGIKGDQGPTGFIGKKTCDPRFTIRLFEFENFRRDVNIKMFFKEINT